MKIIGYNKILNKIKNLFLKVKLKITGKSQVFYINGSESLPPPLSREEESDIMRRLSEGEENLRETLIVHNLRLVVYIAKKFEGTSSNVEDLISIGTIGLIKAVNTFSPERNIKLATYASRCIENEILMFLRKTGNQKTEVSIDEPLSGDPEGNELLLCDILGSDSNTVSIDIEREAEIRELLTAVSRLSKRECAIMELRFGLGGKKEHTQKEVADMLGISQSYISRLEKKILSRLRKELADSVLG